VARIIASSSHRTEMMVYITHSIVQTYHVDMMGSILTGPHLP